MAKISGDRADYGQAEKDREVIGSILDYGTLF